MEIVYSAEIKTNDQQFSNVYLGTSETEVKTKYNNHLKLSWHIRQKKDTEILK